jgi:peptidoglycan/LPS O-acetylase OafA/YrhL
MLARKAGRLWGGYFRGRNVPADPAVLWGHRVLVLAALGGVLAGIARARSGVLAALLLALLACSALNVLFVAEPRHNARMVPVLVAAGVAGWVLAVRGRPRPDPTGTVTA